LSLAWQFVHAVLKHGDFLSVISRGRVATHLRCGGIFIDTLLQIYCRISWWTKFWKSVNRFDRATLCESCGFLFWSTVYLSI